MDNCVKDNNNCYLLAFLSLLIARETFEEVKLGFLVVGHTHEDIDRCCVFVKKIERAKQLYFGRFDEGFYDLTRVTFHSLVDLLQP
jgi:hypothetical protein